MWRFLCLLALAACVLGDEYKRTNGAGSVQAARRVEESEEAEEEAVAVRKELTVGQAVRQAGEGADVEERFEMVDVGGGEENALTDGALCTICYQAIKFLGHSANTDEGKRAICSKLERVCRYFGSALGAECERQVERCPTVLSLTGGIASTSLCQRFNLC